MPAGRTWEQQVLWNVGALQEENLARKTEAATEKSTLLWEIVEVVLVIDETAEAEPAVEAGWWACSEREMRAGKEAR